MPRQRLQGAVTGGLTAAGTHVSAAVQGIAARTPRPGAMTPARLLPWRRANSVSALLQSSPEAPDSVLRSTELTDVQAMSGEQSNAQCDASASSGAASPHAADVAARGAATPDPSPVPTTPGPETASARGRDAGGPQTGATLDAAAVPVSASSQPWVSIEVREGALVATGGQGSHAEYPVATLLRPDARRSHSGSQQPSGSALLHNGSAGTDEPAQAARADGETRAAGAQCRVQQRRFSDFVALHTQLQRACNRHNASGVHLSTAIAWHGLRS